MTQLSSIAIYGPSGAGKTTISNYLVNQYGYIHCSPGQLCRQVTELLFQSQSKQLLNRVNDALKTIDELIWTKAVLASAPPAKPIVYDGLRVVSEFVLFKGRGFRLWKVECSLGERVRRLALRQQTFIVGVDDLHPEEFSLDHLKFDSVIMNENQQLALLTKAVEEALLADNR